MPVSQPATFNLQEFSDAGLLLVAGRLYTYAYGTTNQKTAYTDPAGTVPHTYTADGAGGQYIALNARGELPAPLYLATGSYDLALKRGDGSTIWTRKADGVDNNPNSLAAALAALTGASLIGFLGAGADAVRRTVLDKLRESVSVKDFGAVGDGVADDTAAFAAAFAAKRLVRVPAGTYRGNFVVGNGCRLICAGRGETVFRALTPTKPILHFLELNSSKYYFIGGQDFSVDGENTAVVGIQIGDKAATTGTVTYGSLDRVHVYNCIDNVYAKDTVGFDLNHIYSVSAANSCLRIDINDITTVLSVNCSAFRLGKTGLDLRGGALVKFRDSIIEANRDVGMFYFRGADSGARQVEFDTCWFEGNGLAPVNSYAGSMYIDFDSTVNTEYSLGLRFTNCTLASAAGRYTVFLNRGDEVVFDHCLFDGLNAAKLHYEPGPSAAYATLRQCGTINNRASPTVYAAFPALNSNGGRLQGFKYEYWFQGYKYTNTFKHSFYWQVVGGVADLAGVTGAAAEYTTATLAGSTSNSLAYDHGGNFNVALGTFTAPFTGDYEFNVVWPITNFSAAMTLATVAFNVNGAGQRYPVTIKPIKSYAAGDLETFTGRVRLSLVTGDKVTSSITVAGGAGNTANLYRGASVFAFSGAAV
jgi:hypothetical protein